MPVEYIPKVWQNYKTPILDEDLNHIENGIKEVTDAINDEQTARTNADNTLQKNIDNESKERTESDKTLQQSIKNEASARVNADNSINASLASHGSRLNALESYTVKVDSGGYIAVEYKG